MRYATLWVSTRVLPEPAPAITNSGPAMYSTADGFEALLRDLILNPAQLRHAAAIGREFVARHNDSDLVARRCLEFYNSL